MYTTLILFIISTFIIQAQDWPQFLGPNRNSTSPQKGILRSWPAAGPEVLWTVNVGPGYGGPVIKDGKVYLLDRDDKTGDIMRCFSLSDGKELWKFSYDAPGSVMFPGSRSVPPWTANMYIPAATTATSTALISIPINLSGIRTYGLISEELKLPIWAITQCPLIYGDMVIVSAQAPEAGVVAYNKTYR